MRPAAEPTPSLLVRSADLLDQVDYRLVDRRLKKRKRFIICVTGLICRGCD